MCVYLCVCAVVAVQEYGDKAKSVSAFQRGREGADPVKYQHIVARVGPQLSVILNLSVAIRAAIVENLAGKVSSVVHSFSQSNQSSERVFFFFFLLPMKNIEEQQCEWTI